MNRLFSIIAVALIFASCNQDFLDVKPSQNLRIPDSEADYLAILDNLTNMNQGSSQVLGVIGSDEMYLDAQAFDAIPSTGDNTYQKNAYVWADQVYVGDESQLIDWSMGYFRILWSNIVLDGVKKNKLRFQSSGQHDLIKGMALFHRALNYYNLAQLYCTVYNPNTKDSNLGLPLRLEADVTLHQPRSSLADTYAQIIGDLEEATLLLREDSGSIFRPSKAAAYALLAKVLLQMGMYEEALVNVNSALALKSDLMNFELNGSGAEFSFPLYGENNPEIIFYSTLYNPLLLSAAYLNVDTMVVDLYEEGDFRKARYVKTNDDNSYSFIGSYSGDDKFFTGIATDELFLVRAEASARTGDLQSALADLNTLRQYRIAEPHFEELESSDPIEVMQWIITERRRELLLRGTRWEDLRRWNQDPIFAVDLVRIIGGEEYRLQPNSRKYCWPLPVAAIQNGGYDQNP